MAFQFPNTPTINQAVFNPDSGLTYTWTGTFWSTAPVTASNAISSLSAQTASLATTASYYASRLNIEKVSNIGIGSLILAEGKVYVNKGGPGGLDFFPFGGFVGSTYIDTGVGIPNTTEIVFPDETGRVIDIGVYGNSAYALFDNGDLYTWGENQFGELGIGNTTNRFFPTLATTNVVQVYETVNPMSAIFWYGRLFIKKTDGKVYGAGYNGQGALGLGDYNNRSVFTEIPGIGTNPIGVWNINGYDGWTIAQKSDGTIIGCGANGGSPLGTGGTGNPNTWQTVNGWKNGFPGAIIQKVRGSANWNLGSGANYSPNMNIWIKNGSDSYIMFCGNNQWGNAGVGNTTNRTTPIAANLGTGNILDFERVGGSPGFCYVLLADGTVRAWGYDNQGTLGNGTTTQQTSPVQVFTNATNFYGGNQNYPDYNLYMPSIVIRRSDNTYWRCGSNNYAQCAVGDFSSKTIFTRMLFPNGFTLKHLTGMSSTGDGGSYYAVSTENKIYAWGYNVNNTLIDSSGDNNIPVPYYIQPTALLR